MTPVREWKVGDEATTRHPLYRENERVMLRQRCGSEKWWVESAVAKHNIRATWAALESELQPLPPATEQPASEVVCDGPCVTRGEAHGPACAAPRCGACQWDTRHDPYRGSGHVFAWPEAPVVQPEPATSVIAPCPFCGDAPRISDAPIPPYEGFPFVMAVSSCGVRGPRCKSRADAVAVWNRRTAPQPLRPLDTSGDDPQLEIDAAAMTESDADEPLGPDSFGGTDYPTPDGHDAYCDGNHVCCPSHCCYRHGCKYGHACCPVARGEVRQDHPCEQCRDEENDPPGERPA